MQKYYSAIKDNDGDYVTSNDVRYTVKEVDPARVHIPAGREGDMVLLDTQAEFLASMGLEHVDDHTFAPIPPIPKVLGAVKKYTFHKRLKALGKWKAFKTEIKNTAGVKDLYDNSHELDINDPDVIALSPLIKQVVGVTDAEYDSLFEV
tara:strand:+ start:2398 stop:2844 length:447 start_codon:yes stop_codon:yes gene_type:complete